MNLTVQIAKHLREVYFGGNWTAINFKENLADITWQQAATPVHNFNTIATLVYHTNYYISVIIKALQAEPLVAKDEYSFIHPPILNQYDWENLLENTWAEVERLAQLMEQMSEQKL